MPSCSGANVAEQGVIVALCKVGRELCGGRHEVATLTGWLLANVTRENRVPRRVRIRKFNAAPRPTRMSFGSGTALLCLLAVQAEAAQITSFQRAAVEVPVYSDPDAFNLSNSTPPATGLPFTSMPVGTEFGIAGFKVNKNHVNVDRVVFLGDSGECQKGWAKSNGLYLEKVRDPTPGTDAIKAKCLSRPSEHALKTSGVSEAASNESKGTFSKAFSFTLQHATFKGVMIFAGVVAIMLITSYARIKVKARRFYRSNLGFQTFKTFTQSRIIPFIENSVVFASIVIQFAIVIAYLIYLAKG